MNCTACNKKLLKTNKYCTSCGTERINLDESEELFDNGEFHNDITPQNRNDKNIKLIRIAKKISLVRVDNWDCVYSYIS